MNYNSMGRWNDAVVSLKIEDSRMLGSAYLHGMAGKLIHSSKQTALERLPLPLTAAPDTS